MSTDTTENQKDLYLYKVELCGYKTIYKTEIGFKPGLNIILGINGVGKTNFISFLNRALTMDLKNLKEVHTHLTFRNGKEMELDCKSTLGNKAATSEHITSQQIEAKLYIDGKDIDYNKNKSNSGLFNYLIEKNFLFQSTLIQHGVPAKNFFLVDIPYSFNVDNGLPDVPIFSGMGEGTPFFIKSILASIFFEFWDRNHAKGDVNKSIEELQTKLIDSLNLLNELKEHLKEYSPIEDIRINKNINIFVDREKKKIGISNIFLEFRIRDTWHPFSNLSDGTKRMFYIISEVAFTTSYFFTMDSIGINDKHNNRIILIEEPELGVHPHQLFKIMSFLKKESKNKQIIITTHSPQVLDIAIKEEDLDRVIIAFEDKDKGTLLRHLGTEEITKAGQYMAAGYLSDYWIHSDLEFSYN